MKSMLRRISSLRPRRPRFPEGGLVPWSGLAFAGTTCSLALSVTLASAGDASARHWQVVALLAALAALTPLFTVYGPQFTVYDTAAVFVVAAALLTSPAVAALVGIPACLVDAWRRRVSVVSLAHNSAAIALAAFATSLVAHASSGLSPVPHALGLLVALGCYACIITGADTLFGFFARGMRLQLPGTELVAEAALASIGVGFAALLGTDPWRAPFALAPLLFIHRLQRLPALEEEAARDAKTGLLNMRCFERELERLCAHGQELPRPLSLLVIDLDHLREINNRSATSQGMPSSAPSPGSSTGSCGLRTEPPASEARSSSSRFRRSLPRTRSRSRRDSARPSPPRSSRRPTLP
jgi:ABC-type polysaccharide/polyol phosphate export permease